MQRSRSCPTLSSTRKSSATGALSIEAKDACIRSRTSSERRSQPVPRETRVKLPPEVADVLRSLPPAAKRKVRAALQQLRPEPELGDPLERELIGLRRVRVGQLRIVYRLLGARFEMRSDRGGRSTRSSSDRRGRRTSKAGTSKIVEPRRRVLRGGSHRGGSHREKAQGQHVRDA